MSSYLQSSTRATNKERAVLDYIDEMKLIKWHVSSHAYSSSCFLSREINVNGDSLAELSPTDPYPDMYVFQ